MVSLLYINESTHIHLHCQCHIEVIESTLTESAVTLVCWLNRRFRLPISMGQHIMTLNPEKKKACSAKAALYQSCLYISFKLDVNRAKEDSALAERA